MICFVSFSFSFLGFAVDTLRQNFFCDVCIPLFIDSIGFVSSTFWQKSSSCSSLQVFLPLPIYECRSGPPHINFFLFKIRPLGRFFTGTFHRENEQVLLKVSSDVIGIYVGCYHQVLWSFYSLACQVLPWHEYKLCEKANKTENIHLLLRLKGMSHGTLHSSTIPYSMYVLTSWKLHILPTTLVLVSYMLLKALKHLSTMQSKNQCFLSQFLGWVSSQFLVRFIYWCKFALKIFYVL